MIRVGHATISVCCELPYASTGQSTSEGVMQTQLGLGGLTPGVASACPLPARLRLSPVSTRKSEQASQSSWSIVCGAHGRESDAWWSIPYLIVPLPRSRSPANRRTPARHRGRGDSWLPLQRPCTRGLPLHRACRHRPCLLACRPRSSAPGPVAVSYTHLTLPTICSV